MSFIRFETVKRLISSDNGMDFYIVFKVGDTVDSETVSLLFDRVLREGSDLIQKSDVFTFVDNDLGERLPCYLTFSKERSLWTFRGACFEESIINRCGGFQYTAQTIGDYCVEQFNKAYIKALSSMYFKNTDTFIADIDDYINHNAFTIAGYLISVYSDTALSIFEEKGGEFCREELIDDVYELLKHKDDIYTGDSLEYTRI